MCVRCALLTLAGEGHSEYEVKEKQNNQLALNQQVKQLQYFTFALQSLLELVQTPSLHKFLPLSWYKDFFLEGEGLGVRVRKSIPVVYTPIIMVHSTGAGHISSLQHFVFKC